VRGIVFSTESEIDIRSFTVFGLSSKPKTTSPIGYFGTGLKYAVAVCCRLGVPLKLWIGTTQYEFYAKKSEFRGKDYSQIRMRRRGLMGKWSYEELPFTTEYGRNWQLWQVFRELEANTRDEGGSSGPVDHETVFGVKGKTAIFIESEDFVKIWEARGEVFLDKFMNTYDLKTHVQLTEDRTMMYANIIPWYIAKIIIRCDDEDVVQLAIEEHDEKSPYIERHLDFPDNEAPGETFKRVADRLAARSRISVGARSYGGRWLGTSSFGLGDSRTNDQRFMDNLVEAYKTRDHEALVDLMFSTSQASLVEDMIEQARRRVYGQ